MGQIILAIYLNKMHVRFDERQKDGTRQKTSQGYPRSCAIRTLEGWLVLAFRGAVCALLVRTVGARITGIAV